MWVQIKGQYNITQSVESVVQCVRVCREALEMFGEVWSLAYKIIL